MVKRKEDFKIHFQNKDIKFLDYNKHLVFPLSLNFSWNKNISEIAKQH